MTQVSSFALSKFNPVGVELAVVGVLTRVGKANASL